MSALFLIAVIHSITNSKKKLINEEIIILYITSNALCSFEESVQVKRF